MRLIWRSGTRYHDWSDREQPRRLIEIALSIDAIGAAEWIEIGARTGRKRVRIEAEMLADELLGRLDAEGGPLASAGGTSPAPWELFLALHAWDAHGERVDGANLATFRFDGRPFADEAGSERLAGAFFAAHGPGTTEFAFIHPYERFMDLVSEVYKPPLVNSQMIAGAFWATFLGPGHIEEFDWARLCELSAFRFETVDSDGVYLIASPIVTEAAGSEVERELQRLTDELRAALQTPGTK
jgi:hypothetical protein